jgi:hypothetical protein
LCALRRATAGIAKQPRETNRCAKFPSLGTHRLSVSERVAEVGLRQFLLPQFELDHTAQSERLRPINDFVWIRLEGALHRFQRIGRSSGTFLCGREKCGETADAETGPEFEVVGQPLAN